MSMNPSFDALFEGIGMDYEWPLHHPETLADGSKHWRDLPYDTPTGFRPLMLDVTTPSGPGPFPLVIFIHGGAWLMGHPTISNPTYRKLDLFNRLKQAGYAVARVAYRFSSEAKFPTQLHDCRNAVRYLRKNASTLNVDDKRFAVMGDSAGGHLACLVGFTGNQAMLPGEDVKIEASSHVSAIVNWFGPINFLTMADQLLDKNWNSANDPSSPESRLIGGAVQEHKALARAASPLSYVHKDLPPTLLQYGDLDRLVPFAQAEELAASLKSVGAPFTLSKIKGADHCFWGVDGKPVVDETIEFLNGTIGKTA
jgi:acetyl esterase/lipase